MRLHFLVKVAVLAAVVGVVAAACGGEETPQASSAAPSASASASAGPVQGGQAVLGAEQWPECVNPITSCSSATWYWYSVAEHVLPYAMVVDLQGNFVASPLLTEAPSLDNGGIVESPFTITYKLNPDANWADGTPITSADFEFTWKAILNTKGAYTVAGYDKVKSIDTTDPKTVVITFNSVYTDWPDMFGGVYQGIFEKAAFPDADPDKPDLSKEMLDSIPFSGGPWILDSWSKDQAVFKPNTNYFGQKPYFDQVTIVPRLDQPTEINSLLTGEVDAIFPQPSDVSLLDQFKQNPSIQAEGAPGAYFEALWFNHASDMLKDTNIRKGMMYAINRQAVIDAIIKLNNPSAEVLACGFNSFVGLGPWCDTTYFGTDVFPYDPAKAREAFTAAGYDCSGESFCTKDGEPLTIEYSTVSTNTRRTTTQELLQPDAEAAGVKFKIKNYEAGVLFGDVGPKGKFTMADYATGGSPDPSITASYGCQAIPTEANSFGGGNWNRWCNQDATDLMNQSDQELDTTARLDLMNQIYALEAQDFLSLPLYQLPNVGAWRTDKIAGPISDYIPSNLGMFYNMNYWYTASAS
jgi:peptide/nickel transport system substrate-binding protein